MARPCADMSQVQPHLGLGVDSRETASGGRGLAPVLSSLEQGASRRFPEAACEGRLWCAVGERAFGCVAAPGARGGGHSPGGSRGDGERGWVPGSRRVTHGHFIPPPWSRDPEPRCIGGVRLFGTAHPVLSGVGLAGAGDGDHRLTRWHSLAPGPGAVQAPRCPRGAVPGEASGDVQPAPA